MPRAREALTGHVWLAGLSTDERYQTATIWAVDTIDRNMDWLVGRRLLVLCRVSHGEYTVHCYPRRDTKPKPGADHAAAYVADNLADALQAAVNDYTQTLSLTAQAKFSTVEKVRAVMEGMPSA